LQYYCIMLIWYHDAPHSKLFNIATMNWKLIFLLSLFGIAMAFARMFNLFGGNAENIIWFAILIFNAIVLAKSTTQKLFLHGFLICIINGIWGSAIHLALFDTFVANNPDMVAKFKDLPINQYVLACIMGPVIGIISGAVEGVLTVIAGKFIKPSVATT